MNPEFSVTTAKTEKTDQANPEAVPGEGAHTKENHNKDDTQTSFLGRMGKAIYAIPDVVFNQIPEGSILGTVQSKTRELQKEADELNRKKNEHKEGTVNQD
ncbi:hypothetical protein Ddc_14307 [Ditylenchus destructor]|nr:hypothetical protein Ddc_14307 [Ditylenchus destructor]